MRLQENGKVDGCQEFEPQEGNPKVCDNCDCKKGFHEKIAAAGPPQSVQNEGPGPQAAGVPAAQTSGPANEQPDAAAEGQSSADLQPAKKARIGPGLEGGPVASSAQTEVEKSDSESKEQPSKRPHPTLQKNFEACLKEFPPEKYGVYYLKERGSGKWGVMCEPCNQLTAIQSTNLSNFTRTHITESKHMGNVEKVKNSARLAAEEAAGKEKKLRETREDLIKKYVGQGKVTETTDFSSILHLVSVQ